MAVTVSSRSCRTRRISFPHPHGAAPLPAPPRRPQPVGGALVTLRMGFHLLVPPLTQPGGDAGVGELVGDDAHQGLVAVQAHDGEVEAHLRVIPGASPLATKCTPRLPVVLDA